MNRKHRKSNTFAVSEIVGGLLLLVVAVLAFAAIYQVVFPLPEPDVETHVNLQGYVSANNSIVLEHIGGEELRSYCIDIKYVNNTLIETVSPTGEFKIFDIGDKPFVVPSSVKLNNSDDKLKIVVRKIDGEKEIVFEGILQGRTFEYEPTNDSNAPYLISSLLTDTTNEDLICFNKTSNGESINLSFISTSTAYNWIHDGNSIFDLLYNFDIQDSSKTHDFSGNSHTGTIENATWTINGLIGGAYSYDGNDMISIPYCFSSSKIGVLTIEAWIKTSEGDGTILSYDRLAYFSLAISSGKVKWSVTSNGNTLDMIGQIDLNDNQWHHIAVTYDQSTGISNIYVDGVPDVSSSDLSPGDLIGTGSQTSGYIGKEKGSMESGEYQVIYTDDFESDQGWTVDSDGGLSDGAWERGIPAGLGERGDPPNDYDSTGSGYCFVTDNVRGNSDVDGGETRLISPEFDWSSYENVTVQYAVWYTNDYGNYKNSDTFYVSISNNGGSSWTTVDTIGPNTPTPYNWYIYEFQAEDFIAFTSQMKIRFEASDFYYGSVVEAGVDAINISAIVSGGIGNFTGTIDEMKIYQRSLSEEQIYQNYLLGASTESHRSVIVSEETVIGDIWHCEVTPVNQYMNVETEESNLITIESYGGG